MAAIAAVPAIPNERAYMARVADNLRSFGRKVIQVAKKAGNWIINTTPVRWAWNTVKSIGSKVWGWVRPGARYAHRYVVRPASIAAGATVGFVFGSKILAVLAALGIVGVIAVTIWVVRRRGQEEVVGVEVETSGDPEKPKRPRKKTVTQKIVESVEEITEALEESTQAIEDQTTRLLKADAKLKKAAKKPATKKVVVVTETVPEPESKAADAANGRYKVQLPEGDLDPHETLEMRFHTLDQLIDAEIAKPDEEKDLDYFFELIGRRNLIHVRAGKHSKVKKDATVADVHKFFAAALELTWRDEHLGEVYTPKAAGHNRRAMYLGAQAENGRLNKVRRLKAEHDRLKGAA